ncbi:hypothetical protein GmRootV59_27580 [Variovorax sp. V59]|uniref:Uncharacterized protein n=2 Tax=Variovorax TaxID=34072 RepID=A0AAE3Y4Y0_VARPD|nr:MULTISPECIES: hypothetical protein [Variovorax]MBD9665146.1 hypothetical protein [Variovorax sp. VRV01]MDP9967178.1 hypothetical protein [Variovorax paradoxus]MDR6429413.1 hypothetical protein [Variovorax paradoxus]TWD76759.1 hypothetical protein FB547_111109 [Variovorax beijingensis]
MGIALLAIADLWMPLQSLASRLLPARRPARRDTGSSSAGLRYVAVRPACAARDHAATPKAAPAPVRPLRVIRVVDGPQGERRNTNRMVISGRMADVCAELDRLAALEAMETISPAPRSTQLH